MSRQLSEKDMLVLRQKQLLHESEIAFKDGDTIIGEDTITRVRRVINASGLMLEANRQILHD